MDDSDLDPDPRHRVPTVLWLMLGLVLIVLFATVVVLLGGHVSPRSVGPPAGSP
jgi:hypothetical protein